MFCVFSLYAFDPFVHVINMQHIGTRQIAWPRCVFGKMLLTRRFSASDEKSRSIHFSFKNRQQHEPGKWIERKERERKEKRFLTVNIENGFKFFYFYKALRTGHLFTLVLFSLVWPLYCCVFHTHTYSTEFVLFAGFLCYFRTFSQKDSIIFSLFHLHWFLPLKCGLCSYRAWNFTTQWSASEYTHRQWTF